MRLIFIILAAIAGAAATPAHALEYSQAYSGGNCDRCSWIAAEGEIVEGDAEKLAKFIEAEDIEYQKLIVINSAGGSVSAGLELGLLVRKKGMQVIVGKTTTSEPEGAGRSFQGYNAGICASSCVLVLMGGTVREVADEDTLVGVHQFAPKTDELGSVAATTSSTQSLVAGLQAYANSMGVDPSVLSLASSTAPNDILWLEQRDMERLALLTSRSEAVMADWELKPAGSRLIAIAGQEQSNGRLTSVALDCRTLTVGLQVSSGRTKEIASSIEGASLTLDDTLWGRPLTLDRVDVDGNIVMMRFSDSVSVIKALSQANNRLNISVDLPRPFWAEFGGAVFDIPSSNIAQVAPHILRSCR